MQKLLQLNMTFIEGELVGVGCQDNEDWCQSIPPSYCYSTDKTCCKTCRTF